MKYKMTLVVHTTYTTEIEADSTDEAREMLDEKVSYYDFDDCMEFCDEMCDVYVNEIQER